MDFYNKNERPIYLCRQKKEDDYENKEPIKKYKIVKTKKIVSDKSRKTAKQLSVVLPR